MDYKRKLTDVDNVKNKGISPQNPGDLPGVVFVGLEADCLAGCYVGLSVAETGDGGTRPAGPEEEKVC